MRFSILLIALRVVIPSMGVDFTVDEVFCFLEVTTGVGVVSFISVCLGLLETVFLLVVLG